MSKQRKAPALLDRIPGNPPRATRETLPRTGVAQLHLTDASPASVWWHHGTALPPLAIGLTAEGPVWGTRLGRGTLFSFPSEAELVGTLFSVARMCWRDADTPSKAGCETAAETVTQNRTSRGAEREREAPQKCHTHRCDHHRETPHAGAALGG